MALFLSISCVVYLSHQVYRQALQTLTQEFQEQQIIIAHQTANSFEKDIKLIIREVELISGNAFVIDLDLKKAKETLANTYEYLKKFKIVDIAILNSSGVVELPLIAQDLKGVDFSFRKYFIQAKKQNTKKSTHEFITFKGVDKGDKGIVIAMPIIHPQKGFNGVVVLILKTEDFVDGSLSTENEAHTIWVFENGGNVLYFPSHKFGTNIQELANTNTSFLDFFNKIKSTKEVVSEYTSNSGKKMLVAAHSINIVEQKWVVGVTVQQQKLEDSIAHFKTKYISVISLFILLIIAGAGFVLYSFSRWTLILENVVMETKLVEERRKKLVAEHKIALDKVRVLSGFLPICASCKKVRHDKRYWNQVELFIRNHSEAEFCHSICPECVELHPDFDVE